MHYNIHLAHALILIPVYFNYWIYEKNLILFCFRKSNPGRAVPKYKRRDKLPGSY